MEMIVMVRPTLLLSLALPLVGVCGCATTESLPEGCTVLVKPSADDQTTLQGAMLDAADGDTVCLDAGTFTLNTELSISMNNVTVRGDSRDTTVLDFSTQDLGGTGVKISGDGVTITTLTVKNTPGDGIRGDEVDNITYDDVAVLWDQKASLDNGAYGFYPVGCDGVIIRNSLVVGARDAGIYVGQSTNIIVEDNEAHGNVAGIEIENSTGATVRRNHAHDNSGGILIFSLPGLPVKGGSKTLAYENIVENNNGENFGVAGTAVSKVPPGIGFMILASDYNELRDNKIRGNKSTGVVIVQYETATGQLFEPFKDKDYDIYAQGNWVHDNEFANNGADPSDLIALITKERPVPDLFHDGCIDPARDNTDGSLTNCFSNNIGDGGAASYVNIDLCGSLANQTTDIKPVTCEHTPLSAPM